VNAVFPIPGVLVVANGAHDARATAQLVASLHARENVRIHVAAVQARPTGYAARFLRSVDLPKVLHELARESMAGLCAELDALGVPYRAHVEIGPRTACIERLARELGCARVILGEAPRKPWRNALLRFQLWRAGSAAHVQ
jgi:nucleotide-binding universal stress UspA family protein